MSAADAPGSRAIHEVFPGPRPFNTDEEPLLFGRDREATDLQDLALAYRVLLLYSRSGAGKTSLVNTKLTKELLAAGFHIRRGRVAGSVPRQAELAQSPKFNIHVFNALTTLFPKLSPAAAAHGTLTQHLEDDGSSPYLILDQFEELFTVHPDRWSDRRPFFEQLQQALKANDRLHVLIVIREDYVGSLDPFADFLPGGLRYRYRLERLNVPSATNAIRTPIEKHLKLTFESKELITTIVDDLRRERVQLARGRTEEIGGEFVEPMHLQVVCRNLLANLPAGTKTITREHTAAHANVDEALRAYYDGGVKKAVAKYRDVTGVAGRAANALRRRQLFEAQLRRWIEHDLITGAGTRAFAFLTDVETSGIPVDVVDVLRNERVVYVEPRAGADWVELTHDRLIGPIRRANEVWRQPRQRRAIAVAACLLVAVSALASWQIIQAQTAAAEDRAQTAQSEAITAKEELKQERTTAAQFENVLVNRLREWGTPSDSTELTPTELQTRLSADAKLESMRLGQQCAPLTVILYTSPSVQAITRQRLTDIWRMLTFTVREQNGLSGPTNTVWRGSQVPAPCWRAVACTLIRAGIPVRDVARPMRDAERKRLTIEVGYSENSRDKPPFSVERLWAVE